MTTLYLALKAEYFDDIAAGRKPLEYRLCTPYWAKRLKGRSYDRIVLTKGYPAAGDTSRRIERAWNGYELQMLMHPLFGNSPVQVFAIDVRSPAP